MGRRASVSRRATVYAVSPRSAKVTPASYGVFSRRVEFSHGASRRMTTMGPAGQGELSSSTAGAGGTRRVEFSHGRPGPGRRAQLNVNVICKNIYFLHRT